MTRIGHGFFLIVKKSVKIRLQSVSSVFHPLIQGPSPLEQQHGKKYRICFQVPPLGKNERGYFHVIYYSVAPSAINEIERRFRINEDLLRFVTIKYDTNREVTAWNQLVQKAQKKATQPAGEAKVEEVVIPAALEQANEDEE